MSGSGGAEADGRFEPPAPNLFTDIELPVQDHRSLREICESLGVPPAEIEAAEREGSLAMVALERLAVPDERRYTQQELEARTALGLEARRFWRALGMPDPPPDEKAFTDADLRMLQMLEALFAIGLVERAVAFQMARVIGSSMARIVEAQLDAIENRIAAEDDDGIERAPVTDEAALLRGGVLLGSMPKILEYAWRRQLQSAARRRLVREPGGDGGVSVAVGFADLVGFTQLVEELTEKELGEIVDRFEDAAYGTVASHGGRVVKMIGDEVMFEADNPSVALDIGLALADIYRADEALSGIRVGLAYGPVLQRDGDLYGTTVNLASRIVAIAYSGAVVVSPEMREVLVDREDIVMKPLRLRYLKGIGRVRLWAVRRADDADEGILDRARKRQTVLREKVTELMERAMVPPSLIDQPVDDARRDTEEEEE